MEEHWKPQLERAWPLFGLSVVHRDLLLREATDDDVLALARVVEDGVVEAGNEHFMPRLLLGRAATIEERLANFLRYHWARRSATAPENWDLAFAVLLDGRVVGSQAVHTSGLPGPTGGAHRFVPSGTCPRGRRGHPHESNGPGVVVRPSWRRVGDQWVRRWKRAVRRVSTPGLARG